MSTTRMMLERKEWRDWILDNQKRERRNLIWAWSLLAVSLVLVVSVLWWALA
jgi:hypothetical protein